MYFRCSKSEHDKGCSQKSVTFYIAYRRILDTKIVQGSQDVQDLQVL